MKPPISVRLSIPNIVDWKWWIDFKHPFTSSLFKLCLLGDIGFVYFAVARADEISTSFFVGYLGALLWMNIGPYLIWYYDRVLLKKFLDNLPHLLASKTEAMHISKRYRTLFTTKYWMAVIPWSILVLVAFFLSTPHFEAGGLHGTDDPAYWATIAATIWGSILTGIGFFGVVTTAVVLQRVARMTFRIDPFHPDGIGGLSATRSFMIGTTLLFATGSLFIPILLVVASKSLVVGLAEYILIAIYSLFILLSYVAPAWVIQKKVDEIKHRNLHKLWRDYRRQSPTAKSIDVPMYLRTNRILQDMGAYRNLHAMFLNPIIILELTFSIIAPVFFLGLEVSLRP